ncbi:MAG: hypothetical protein QFB87_04585 [Patescibacteria group bacterium]|nr:hypothetical protein [Patescibacteria group bacterium]
MASTALTDDERDKLKQLFIDYFEDVPVVKYAAYYIGIAESTAYDWMAQDEDFRSCVNQAKSRWARKRAKQTKAEFQLERLDKEVWREQKDITTNGESIVTALVQFIGEDDSADTAS